MRPLYSGMRQVVFVSKIYVFYIMINFALLKILSRASSIRDGGEAGSKTDRDQGATSESGRCPKNQTLSNLKREISTHTTNPKNRALNSLACKVTRTREISIRSLVEFCYAFPRLPYLPKEQEAWLLKTVLVEQNA